MAKKNNSYAKYWSRTFWIVSYILIVSTGLVVFGKLVPGWITISLGVLGSWTGIKWIKKNRRKDE